MPYVANPSKLEVRKLWLDGVNEVHKKLANTEKGKQAPEQTAKYEGNFSWENDFMKEKVVKAINPPKKSDADKEKAKAKKAAERAILAKYSDELRA